MQYSIQPNVKQSGLKSFSYKGAKVWNTLPCEIRNAISVQDFKELIKPWGGPKCICTLCTKMLW